MEKTIQIKAHPVREKPSGVVRISPEAETALRQLQRQSGLSARYLASEIILQGAELVEFVGAGEDGGIT